MNKHLIALAVAAATLSTTASAAQVFSNDTSSLNLTGRIETAAVASDNDISNSGTNKARIGLKGETQIADGVKAVGYVEKDFADSDADTRYLYVGVANANNQLVYGQANGSLGMITDFTDIMSFGGGAAGQKMDAADRTDNNLAYVGTFNNLTVKANYVFDGDKSNTEEGNHHGYSAGVKYAMDNGLAFGTGYAQQNKGTTNAKHKQAYAGASYTMGDLYLGGLFIENHEDGQKKRGYEYAASYTMGKTVFTATYNYLARIHHDIAGDRVDTNQAGVDATYYFNPNFRAYAGYKAYMGDNHHDKHNAFALGARYDF